jgi:hypothetical protein
MFAIGHKALARLFQASEFALPADDAILFGLRGALPTNESDAELRPERNVELQDIDNVHPRCTIGVWDQKNESVAVFPGSTVPFKTSIEQGIPQGGQGTNQVMESYVTYVPGKHPGNKGPDFQYPAFIQSGDFPHRRTKDDLDFDQDDDVFVAFPGDNLHAAFSESSGKPFFSSFGCQVVCGFSKRKHLNIQDMGMWPRFRDLAMGFRQKSYRYALLQGREAQAAATTPDDALAAKLYFGSKGPLTEKVQKALKTNGFPAIGIDGDFGRGTLTAVVAFQKRSGLNGDGIVGQNTADALGIGDKWPRF